MKILFVNFTRFWGGGENWTLQIMEELRKRNHQIVLLSNNHSKLSEKATEKDFEVHSCNISKIGIFNLAHQPALYRILKNTKPDSIFINSTLELRTIGLQLIASGNNKNVVFNRSIPIKIRLSLFKKLLFKRAVTNVVVNSYSVKHTISNLLNYTKHEAEVIYHGIEIDTTKEAPLNNKNIAVIGRLSYEKGVDLALDALKIVIEHEPDTKLWIIGDGKERENLEKKAENLSISKSVEFKGFVKDVDAILCQCSLLVLPSRWEGFGLVLLEAMRLGIPCIAFDHTAANEIIIDNHSGFLIPNMDIELLANKMHTLISDKLLAEKMGKNGKEIAKEKFAMEICMNKYEKILKNQPCD